MTFKDKKAKFYDSPTQKELVTLLISSLLIAFVFGIALYNRFKPPIHEVVINKVFEVQHRTDQYGQDHTFVYTYGQGMFGFLGTFEFEEGKSYYVKYHKTDKRWKDLKLLKWEEVIQID